MKATDFPSMHSSRPSFGDSMGLVTVLSVAKAPNRRTIAMRVAMLNLAKAGHDILEDMSTREPELNDDEVLMMRKMKAYVGAVAEGKPEDVPDAIEAVARCAYALGKERGHV